MKHLSLTSILVMLLTISASSCNQDPEKEDLDFLPNWKEGYLDIHQISTGKGDAAYMMFPDGTTMLVDAGDIGEYIWGNQELMDIMPNDSKSPAEWIVNYIHHFSSPLKNGTKLDYAMMTHFHDDHIGQIGPKAKSVEGLGYKLAGITHLDYLLTIDKLVDRAYPEYMPMTAGKNITPTDVKNYQKCVIAREKRGLHNERFIVGSNTQFVLKHKAGMFPDFEIRNVVGNGTVWNPENEDHLISIAEYDDLNENNLSCGIRISYGDFDYFTGGDISGRESARGDGETPVGNVIGEIDVVQCNHHGYSDAMNDAFIQATHPQAFIIPIWDSFHPEPEPLASMLSHELYEGERDVYAAGIVANTRKRLGKDGAMIKPDGHVVVRVYPKGEKFRIYVLDNKSDQYGIVYKSPIYFSKQ